MNANLQRKGAPFLLLSGLGPCFLEDSYLRGSLFDSLSDLPSTSANKLQHESTRINLDHLIYTDGEREFPLLRPLEDEMPQLVSATLESILQRHQIDCISLPIDIVWRNEDPPLLPYITAVGLSTTFMWNIEMLIEAVEWVKRYFPYSKVVLGGQYSSLKTSWLMEGHLAVDYVALGDGEVTLPAIVRVMTEDHYPENLLRIQKGLNGVTFVSPIEAPQPLDVYSKPSFKGLWRSLPYMSSRGCPHHCGFCAYPDGSPTWRYLSEIRVVEDWKKYRNENGTEIVRVMDSAFTTPPRRFASLLALLPAIGMKWTAFARADCRVDAKTISLLEDSQCDELSIGFESMSDITLSFMKKGTTSEQNRKVNSAFKESWINIKCSFIVGYPGETESEFDKTKTYLLNDHYGNFFLHIFEFEDDTLPVGREKDKYGLRVEHKPIKSRNREHFGTVWSHCGMDSIRANELRQKTLEEVRRGSNHAVYYSWQLHYSRPLVPSVAKAKNLAIEKSIERLAFVRKDTGSDNEEKERVNQILRELSALNVRLQESKKDERRS